MANPQKDIKSMFEMCTQKVRILGYPANIMLKYCTISDLEATSFPMFSVNFRNLTGNIFNTKYTNYL